MLNRTVGGGNIFMAKRTPLRQSARYAEIAQALRSEIEHGNYRIGDKLPTEHELCEKFAASRFTVRHAIAWLRDQGFVDARPGIGTRVIALQKRDAFVQTLNSTEELLQYPGDTYRTHLDKTHITATPELAMMLRCPLGAEWSKLTAMRIARPDLPISWLDVYVQPRFAGVYDLPNPSGEPVLRQIESHYGHHAVQAQVEIFVSRIREELAEPLRCEPGAAAMVILRRYRGSDNDIYLVTYSVHPENRFSLNFEFERQ